MLEKFETLVIDPDVPARMRIKQATASVPTFGKVVQVNGINEGLEKIHCNKFDVIFVSCQFPENETAAFIRQSKSHARGQDAAFILVFKTAQQEAAAVAQNVLVGADGLLFEPYSVDSLVEITRLASKVKHERTRVREIAAIKVLLKDIIELTDLVSFMKAINGDIGPGMKKLKKLSSVIQGFDEFRRELYFEVAIEEFGNAVPPIAPTDVPAYNGVSSRIRKRLEERIAAKLSKKD